MDKKKMAPWIVAAVLATGSSSVWANDSLNAALGGGLGGAAGAVVGQMIGGNTGAIVGAGLGGAGGAVLVADHDDRSDYRHDDTRRHWHHSRGHGDRVRYHDRGHRR